MARVLHVEDRSDWRNTVAEVLKGAGHKVVSCATMAKAKEAYSKGKFDLVIADGSIEQTDDGLNWARQLHGEGQKVLALAGLAASDLPSMSKGAFDTKALLKML